MTDTARVHRVVTDGIARLTISNPPVNILTRAVLGELRRHVTELGNQSDVRVVLLGAEGKHFSAGADVAEHVAPTYQELIPEFVATIRTLWECPIPIVAAVRGRCLGGGFEVVQPADAIVAGEGAMFGQPEILLGVLPPAACALLPRLCGAASAALVLGGDPVSAADARAMGLVTKVVEDDTVDDAAAALAARFARHSGASLRITKRALRAGFDRPAGEALAEVERLYISDLMRTKDANEGIQAFLAKRPPVWEHR
jgi:cyclohexa-1,5-dienecarbonyl-CoA hydratase